MTSSSPRVGRVQLGRLVAEFLVVVMGVVVGLGVDSAREARTDSGRTTEYLTNIRDDLRAGEIGMTHEIDVSQGIQENAGRLLQGLNSRNLPPTDSLRGWWASLFRSGSYRATTPTISALISLGDTPLVPGLELRRAILEFHDKAETDNTWAQLSDASIDRALQGMGQTVSLDNLDSSHTELRLPIDWDAVADDHWFHSQVQIVLSLARARAVDLRGLLETASELRETIEAALQES